MATSRLRLSAADPKITASRITDLLIDSPPVSAINIPRRIDRLCYRYPSPLVDAITEHEPGRRLVAVKNVTVNEDFFQGHFPGSPLMPGVLMIETLAQVATILLMHAPTRPPIARAWLRGVNNAKFRLPGRPRRSAAARSHARARGAAHGAGARRRQHRRRGRGRSRAGHGPRRGPGDRARGSAAEIHPTAIVHPARHDRRRHRHRAPRRPSASASGSGATAGSARRA